MRYLLILLLLLLIGCVNQTSHKNTSIQVEDYSFNTEIKYIKKSRFYEDIEDYKNALKYTLMVAKIEDRVNGVVPITYKRIADFYYRLGNYKKAKEYEKKVINLTGAGKKIEKKLRKSVNPTKYLKSSIQSERRGDYKKAQSYMFKALDYLNDKNSDSYALACNRISSLFEVMGEYNKALEYGFKALDTIKKRGEDNIGLFQINLNLSIIFQRLGDFNKAKKFALKAMDYGYSIKDKELKPRKLANGYNNLSVVYNELNILKKAKKYAFKSLKIREKILDKYSSSLSESYNNIGLLYRDLGNNKKAKEYLLKSLEIDRKKYGENHPKTSITYNNLSIIEQNLKHFDKAEEYSLKSLKIDKKKYGENHISIATDYINLASIYLEKQNFNLAKKYTQKSISIYKTINPNHIGLILAYNNLSFIYGKLKNYQKAKESAYKALKLANGLSKNHQSLETTYNMLSLSYHKIGDYSNSYKYAKKSFSIFKTNKNSDFGIIDNREKLKYLKWHKSSIVNLFKSGYSLKNISTTKDIFNSWLNYKRTVFDIENSLRILYYKTNDKVLKENIEKLYILKRKLGRFNQTQYKNSQKIKKIEQNISQIEQLLSSKLFKLHLQDITYLNIANILKRNELYIDFAKIYKNYYIFTLDKNQNIIFKKIDKRDTEEIERYITRIREDVRDIPLNNIKKKYAKLYNLIFKNINLTNKTSLIISPDGLLGLIPFEAFYIEKEQKYLIEKLKIRYIPSGKELIKFYKNRTVSKDNIIVFANPNFGLKIKGGNSRKGTIDALYNQAKSIQKINSFFSTLTGSIVEADTISSLFRENTEIYMKDKANEENLLNINIPKILHLSTHGFFINDKRILNPMLKAGIALSGANYAIKTKTGEGIVTALELSGINLNGTELVVLSACETGVGDVEEAEGVASLSKAFMRAGAKYIIMSLWSVDDNATATLMKKLYQNIKNGKNYSQALREAKLFMINSKKSHPFYWSGFIGSGSE